MTQTLSVLPEHEQPATALPKFQPGEKVTFLIKIPITAVIEEVYSDEEEGFSYSVKQTHAHTEELDPGLNPDIYIDFLGDVIVDELSTIIAQDLILKHEQPPSCEFDPN